MKKSVLWGLASTLVATQALAVGGSDLTERYALKQRCGEQVARYFHAQGNNEGLQEDSSGTNSTKFEAHFNPKSLKCFMSYTYVSNPFRDKKLRGSTTRALIEVNENRTYASLFVFDDGTVMDCVVGDRHCRSASDWEALVIGVFGE